MKMHSIFRSLGAILLLSQLSCDILPGRDGPEQDRNNIIVAIYPSNTVLSLPATERALFDGTKKPLHLHYIWLPYNCPVSFVIANEGTVGTLKYSIDDVGALGGFLDYTNGSGSLDPGQSATINVTVDPLFTYTGLGSLDEDVHVLTINTPNASNYKKTVVSVHIRDYAVEVKEKLCGTWQGTWTGTSIGPSSKTAALNGTWTFNLLSVDWSKNTGTATLLWSGNEAWWDYWLGAEVNTNATPHYVNINRSYVFNDKVTEITGISPCDEYNWQVSVRVPKSKYFGYYEEIGYVPGPENLDFILVFSSDLKSLKVNSSWSSKWWNPLEQWTWGDQRGKLSGSKIN